MVQAVAAVAPELPGGAGAFGRRRGAMRGDAGVPNALSNNGRSKRAREIRLAAQRIFGFLIDSKSSRYRIT